MRHERDTGLLLPWRCFGALPHWPYRPKPQRDELLSSWLIRIAAGMDLKPITFLNAVWGSRQSLLNQDLDNLAPKRVVDLLAQAVGVESQAIIGTTLSELDGRLTASYNARGRKTWILPTTIKSNDRRRPGLQFCPACLGVSAD